MIDENTFTDQFTEVTKNFIKDRLALKGVNKEQVQDVLSNMANGLLEDPKKNKHVFLHLLANLETAVKLCHRFNFPKDKLIEEVNLCWDRAEKTQLNLSQELQKLKESKNE